MSDHQAASARPFRMTWSHRAGNALIAPLIRAGLVPHTYLLTTRGRKTGKFRTNPVVLVERDGRRWLVAPYGQSHGCTTHARPARCHYDGAARLCTARSAK